MQPRLVIVGFGNVGHAIVRGAIESGIAAPSEIGVMDPEPTRIEEAREMGMRAVQASAIPEAELVVLAVKPQSFAGAANSIGKIAASGPLVISVMAGVRSNSIRDALGGAARVVRTMPNTPAAVRRAITAIASDADVVEPDFQKVEQLFASVGRTVRVPEALFDAVTAVSGSGPAFVFRFLEAWAYAAEEIGLPQDTARALARETLIGAATLLDTSKGAAHGVRHPSGGLTNLRNAGALGALEHGDHLRLFAVVAGTWFCSRCCLYDLIDRLRA